MMLKINPYPTSIYRCSQSADSACLLNAEPKTKLSVRCLGDISSCGSTTYTQTRNGELEPTMKIPK